MDPQQEPAEQPQQPAQPAAPVAATPAMPAVPETGQKPAKTGGYGKRPMWQWILLYVIVAVVLYGLVYFLFLKGDGGVY